MLLREGENALTPKQELCSVEWACASAAHQSFVKVYLNGEQIEEVHLGAGCPHTWWGTNPLLGGIQLSPRDRVLVELGPGAVMRLEGAFDLAQVG